MEGARLGSQGAARSSLSRGRRGQGAGVDTARLKNRADVARELKKLEGEMYRHARNLEFEQAAVLRDQIEQLRQLDLEISFEIDYDMPAQATPSALAKAAAAATGVTSATTPEIEPPTKEGGAKPKQSVKSSA